MSEEAMTMIEKIARKMVAFDLFTGGFSVAEGSPVVDATWRKRVPWVRVMLMELLEPTEIMTDAAESITFETLKAGSVYNDGDGHFDVEEPGFETGGAKRTLAAMIQAALDEGEK